VPELDDDRYRVWDTSSIWAFITVSAALLYPSRKETSPYRVVSFYAHDPDRKNLFVSSSQLTPVVFPV